MPHDAAELAVGEKQPDEALAAIVELRELLDQLEELVIDRARKQGWSWSEIARPLGVTRQAVHRKHARRLEQRQALKRQVQGCAGTSGAAPNLVP